MGESKTETERRPTTTDSPLVFVSHDTRDAELAECFSKLLSSVSAGVLKSFRSSDKKDGQGIEFGVEWYPHLMDKLAISSDVVCLLTKNSLNRPWILYEAGVSKGKLNTPVYGVAIGVPLSEASTGPFAQFQNCDDEAESLTTLVMQLLGRVAGAEPDREAIKMQVALFKERAAAAIKVQPSKAEKEKTRVDDSSAKLFEEIKVMFRDLPERLESQLGPHISRNASKRRRMFEPKYFHELSMMMIHEFGDPGGILVLASPLQDEYPWLYQMALELYTVVKSGRSRTAGIEQLRRFVRAVDMTMRGPWQMDLRKDEFMMLRHIPDMIEEMVMRFLEMRFSEESKVKSDEKKAASE